MTSATRNRFTDSQHIYPPLDPASSMDERWARPWLQILRDEFRIGRRRVQRFLEDPSGEVFDLLLALFGCAQPIKALTGYSRLPCSALLQGISLAALFNVHFCRITQVPLHNPTLERNDFCLL